MARKEKRLGWMRSKVLKWAVKPLVNKRGRGRRKSAISFEDFEHFFKDQMNPESVFTDLSTMEQQKRYKINSLVWTCVRKINGSFLEAPPEVGNENPDGGWDVAEEHYLTDLLKRPNPDMSYGQFMKYFLIHLLTTGKSFIWEWRNNAREVNEMWPIPSSWVTPVTMTAENAKALSADESRIIKSYVVTLPGGKEIPVAAKDMTYARFEAPDNFVDGISPVAVAAHDIETDTERSNYMMEMLTNLKVPGLILTQQEEFTDPQKEDIRAALGDMIGKGKRGSPLLLSGEGAGAEIIAPLKDLDWPGLANLSETRICAAYGVPPTLLGLRSGLETAGLSGQDVQAAERVFYRGTMQDLWQVVADVLTLGLLQQEGDDEYVLRFNTENVVALQEDLSERSAMARDLFLGGIILRDEARGMIRLPADKVNGNVYALPMTIVTTDAATGKSTDPLPEGTGKEAHFAQWDSKEEGGENATKNTGPTGPTGNVGSGDDGL